MPDDAYVPPPTVWILGSGFSKPLGGPLLDDLLSDATNALVDAIYPTLIEPSRPVSAEHADAAAALQVVRTLFSTHGPVARGNYHQRFWSDAEAFLDYVDAAAQSGVPANIFLDSVASRVGVRDVRVDGLRHAGRRLVAAACCAFLHAAIPMQERWKPYRSWAEALNPSDTIVTFNYDRVLELLKAFDIFVPGEARPDGARPVVFKLHGSVDWARKKQGDGTFVYSLGRGDAEGAPVDPEFALTCPVEEIGIATPGPTKEISTEELGPVWRRALERIKTAEVIVFVGYRFPPSDAEAREKLLGAIRENANARIDVHTVLGPRQHADDVVRLAQMLKAVLRLAGRKETAVNNAAPSYWVATHALYAEDFFTVWNRDLLRPYDHRGNQ